MIGVAELVGFGILGAMVWDLVKYIGKDVLSYVGRRVKE